MARVTAATERLYEELGVTWPLSLGQLQQAVEAKLGPMADTADPPAHWRALAALAAGESLRLPKSDEAAIELAIAGHPCSRLPGALRRIVANTDPPRDPEEVAEELMGSHPDGDDTTYGARLAQRMRSGAVGRPGSTGEAAQLEQLGQAQAVMVTFSEVGEGGSVTDQLDPDDIAQVFGMPVELVRSYIPALAAVFGTHDVLDTVDSLVEKCDVRMLAAAVTASAGLLPFFEKLVCPVGTAQARLRWVAQVVPVVLTAGDIYRAITAQVGGPEQAAALPSIVSSEWPTFTKVAGSLLAIGAARDALESPGDQI